MGALLILAACTSPGKTTPATNDPGKNDEKRKIYTGMMVPVHTPQGVFFIDRFEVSELGEEDYFPARNQLPKTRIPLESARKVCEGHGKRLCSEYEWVNACLGTQRQRFSYGNSAIPDRCNLKGTGTVPGGRKALCQTDSGAYDMVGNVMEWVEADGPPTAKGGSFASGEASDCFTTQFFAPGTTSDQIGFRCCANVENP